VPRYSWLYDRSGYPYDAILFAIALFGLAAAANASFRLLQRATAPKARNRAPIPNKGSRWRSW
jgi:hypothetical protein